MHFLPRTPGITIGLLLLACSVASAQTQFTAYPCRHQSADALAAILRPLLPQRDDVQLIVDRNGKRLLLSGPVAVQTIAERVMRESDRSAQSGVHPTVLPPRLQQLSTGDKETKSTVVPMDAGAQEASRKRLAIIFGDRLRLVSKDDPTVWALRILDESPNEAWIEFNASRSHLRVIGPPRIADQLVTLISRLVEQNPSGYRTQVYRLERKNHELLHNAVQEIRAGQPLPIGSGGRNDQSRFVMPRNSLAVNHSNDRSDPAVVQQTVFQNQSQNDAQSDTVRPDAGAPQTGDPTLRQFEGVEIESLPDLDVIILRGRNSDLEQLADIVRQLERISQETQPEVRILALEHAASLGVAEVINETLEELIGGRQGTASVVPLIKPNALLLIGWGDAIEAVVGMAKQLDTPVTASTQSTVFQLKFASAAQLENTIQQFLSGREGLGPNVTLSVDERTNALIVYAAPRDLQEVAKLVQELDRPGGSTVQLTRVFEIRNSLAADIAQTLQDAIDQQSANLALEVMGPDGVQVVQSGSLDQTRITANVRNNTVIISSQLENMEMFGALIDQLDAPAGEVQLKIFQIINGDAASMIETLRSLLPSQSETSATSPLQLSSAAGESSLAPLRFSLDLRSNSIIATGSEGDLQIVEALLLRLDQSTDRQRKSSVIQLKNAAAVDVAGAINQYLLNQRQIERSFPGARNPFQDLEREVVVVPEPVANKIVLAATPRYYDEIKALIDQLDEQPPQVMIQVLIAEVALNSLTEFGIELGVQSSVLFDRSLLGDLLTTTNTTQVSTAGGVTTLTEELIRAASNIPGFIFNSVDPLGNSGSATAVQSAGVVGGQGISNFAVGRGSDQTNFGGLVLSANSRNVSVLLRALNETRHVRVLSRPQIRTLDNQPAYIQVGQRVPRIVGSTVNQNGQSNSIQLENVGLILGVTPRVSPDNMVVMEIDAERSKLGDEIDGIPVAVSVDGTIIRSPRVDTTTAQATVSAANGETIILGGLISEDRRGIHRRVPYLSDIPILRNLFKYDSDDWRRTELLIILTPHVIRTADDGERLKHMEIARMHWCESDVYRVHGDINASQVTYVDQMDASETPVVYPDLNPSGEFEPVIVAPAPLNPMIEFPDAELLPGLPDQGAFEEAPFDGKIELQAP